MPITITMPQLRDCLRRLEANVSAEELWCALQQQDLPIPAPGDWPQATQPQQREVQPIDTLAHYRAMADEAVSMAAKVCGPMQQVNVESPEFCTTGSRFVQPMGQMKDGFYGVECNSLDAPPYIPRGSVSCRDQNGNTVFAECSGLRA